MAARQAGAGGSPSSAAARSGAQSGDINYALGTAAGTPEWVWYVGAAIIAWWLLRGSRG